MLTLLENGKNYFYLFIRSVYLTELTEENLFPNNRGIE